MPHANRRCRARKAVWWYDVDVECSGCWTTQALVDNAGTFHLQLIGMLYTETCVCTCVKILLDVGAKLCSFEVPCVVAWSGTKAKICAKRYSHTGNRTRANPVKADYPDH